MVGSNTYDPHRAQGPSDEEVDALQRQLLHSLDSSASSLVPTNESLSLADRGSALDRAVDLARARAAEPLLSGPSSGLVNTASQDSFISAPDSAVPHLAEQLVSSSSSSAPFSKQKGKARARSRSPSPAPASPPAAPSTPPRVLDADDLVKTFSSLSPLTMGRLWSQIKRGSKRRREPSFEGHQQAAPSASAPKVARPAPLAQKESLPRQPSRQAPPPPPDIPEVRGG
ncbi:unnamed protein product [Tilletia controversa]|nr:unnamed protein product [Tilletia controversa]